MEVINLEDLRHGIRVANYSVQLATQLHLSSETIKNLYLSGLFHDIGKAYLNQNILNKPDKLTKDEKTEIMKHILFSYDEVLNMGYPTEVALNILHHHENCDGTGYPKGIKGNSIPLGARILKITDVFDALTMKRPYREQLTIEQALKIMEAEITTYDPELYYIFTNNLLKNVGQANIK